MWIGAVGYEGGKAEAVLFFPLIYCFNLGWQSTTERLLTGVCSKSRYARVLGEMFATFLLDFDRISVPWFSIGGRNGGRLLLFLFRLIPTLAVGFSSVGLLTNFTALSQAITHYLGRYRQITRQTSRLLDRQAG